MRNHLCPEASQEPQPPPTHATRLYSQLGTYIPRRIVSHTIDNDYNAIKKIQGRGGTAGRSSQHLNQALPRTQRAIVFASCRASPLTPEDAGKIGSHRRYTGEALLMDYLTSRPQGAILGSRGRLTSSPPDVMAYRGRLSALGSPTLNLERSDQLRLSNLQPVPSASHVQQPWASVF
ncbi:hypothetical protein FALCPG4_003875 [Fusarium falciforme]